MISLTRRRILKLSLKADEKTSISVVLQQGRGLRKKLTFLTSNFGLSESVRSELSVFKPGVAQGSGLEAGGCGSRNLCIFSPVFSTLSWSFLRSRWLVFSCYLCCKPDLHWKVLDSWVRSTHWTLYCILEELIVKAAIIYSFSGANTILSVYWPAQTDHWLPALRPFQS